jgi:hypothetical protein
MENLEIEPLEEKDELNADEVSITMKQSIESDWISASESLLE